MSKRVLRIGSRQSPLALMQTRLVMAALQAHYPDLELQLITFNTKGDLILDTTLSQVGDKGLFVKELEWAILGNEIDLAVHSLKDLPGTLPDGLVLQSFGEREDPRDVLITPNHVLLPYLNSGSRIGTSSLRRIAQFKRIRNDLTYDSIRGNLQTRLRKLEEGQFKGIILAAAGVHRMGWQPRIAQYFDPLLESTPAVGQGILGLEFNGQDEWVKQLLFPLKVEAVETAMVAERSFLKTLEGGCQVPIAGYAKPEPSENTVSTPFSFVGKILSLTGEVCLEERILFEASQANEAGQQLATLLLKQGGAKILADIKENVPTGI
jgi:hydroxymethylbilane synthase